MVRLTRSGPYFRAIWAAKSRNSCSRQAKTPASWPRTIRSTWASSTLARMDTRWKNPSRPSVNWGFSPGGSRETNSAARSPALTMIPLAVPVWTLRPRNRAVAWEALKVSSS